MKSRRRANPRIDKKIFKRTASTTKRVNLYPCNMRGGICL